MSDQKGTNQYITYEKMRVAFEIAARFDTVEVIEARTYIQKQKLEYSFKYGEHSPKQFHDIIRKKPKIHSVVKQLLGMGEDVSLAIQFDYANEKVLNRSLGNIICWLYKQFVPYIKIEREEAKNQSLYSELEKLYKAWHKGDPLAKGSKEKFSSWSPADRKKSSKKNPSKKES